MGVKMYFLLAPNAANILSDKLPATVRLNDQNKYMDDFFSNIKSSGITPVDVRSTFAAHKAQSAALLPYRSPLDHRRRLCGFQKACKRHGP
jgi:hypothetical protein